jgi:hypothetical protein
MNKQDPNKLHSAHTAGAATAASQQVETIPWERAIGYLYKGEVAEVSDLEAEEISLTLKDGQRVMTAQPMLGSIIREIENCGPPCVDVVLAQVEE